MSLQDKVNLLMAYKVDKHLRAVNNNRDSYEFTNVNKMFVDTALQVRECFKDAFGGELSGLVS